MKLKTYNGREEVIKTIRGDENLIILGDWNAVVGEGHDSKMAGRYGLESRDDRGERLIEFCVQNGLITDTIFCNNPQKRYTWRMPEDRRRFQKDCILVKQMFSKSSHRLQKLP
jgi:hypothetical protein